VPICVYVHNIILQNVYTRYFKTFQVSFNINLCHFWKNRYFLLFLIVIIFWMTPYIFLVDILKQTIILRFQTSSSLVIIRTREFMHLRIDLANSYLTLDDIEIHFKVPWLSTWSFILHVFEYLEVFSSICNVYLFY